MTSTSKRTRDGRRGVVYVLALLFLALFSALAVAFAARTNLVLRAGGNYRQSTNARLAAEGGVSYLAHLLVQIDPGDATDQELLNTVAASLANTLGGSPALQGVAVSYDSATIGIPPIAVDGQDGTFSATIRLDDTREKLMLRVTGQAHAATRKAGVDIEILETDGGGIFKYAFASKGKFFLEGNARIKGANDPSEASIYSGTTADDALSMGGNAYIEGDFYAMNPDAVVDMWGNAEISGYRSGQSGLDDHIHTGVEEVPFPEVDPTQFESLPTTTITASTSTNGNKTFNNIRIKANANKQFNGNIRINGIVFIEVPNVVIFTGNLTIKGMIVTQDAGENAYDANRIEFRGNTTIDGVESLPDEAQYATLKEMTGSTILAPGFGLDFRGNFGTISGGMAADKFTFAGNAGGTVKGTIINYSDTLMDLRGNANFTFDRSGCPDNPAGFIGGSSKKLAIVVGSYTEN